MEFPRVESPRKSRHVVLLQVVANIRQCGINSFYNSAEDISSPSAVLKNHLINAFRWFCGHSFFPR